MYTLAAPCRFEENIKRSRFIAHAGPVTSEAATLAFYESVADESATHNCWAWRLDLRVRSNDDGEPSGTAGRPMLGVLEGRDLDRIMVVVTRHFGGIKLGVGGLVRAYSGTVAKCLDQATMKPIVQYVRCELVAGFTHISAVHQLLEQQGARKLSEAFDENGVIMKLEVPNEQVGNLTGVLNDLSRGSATLRRIRS